MVVDKLSAQQRSAVIEECSPLGRAKMADMAETGMLSKNDDCDMERKRDDRGDVNIGNLFTGSGSQTVIIDDPPVENAELEGTERERYEAAIQLAEQQGKALRLACRDENLTEMMRLIDCKTDVNAGNMSGTPPLHEAAYGGKPEALAFLLKHGAIVDKPDIWGATALHFAAAHGSSKCCSILLEHGANVDLRRHDMQRPYDIVDRGKHPQTFDVLAHHSMALAIERRKEKQKQIARVFMGSVGAAVVSYLLMSIKNGFT